MKIGHVLKNVPKIVNYIRAFKLIITGQINRFQAFTPGALLRLYNGEMISCLFFWRYLFDLLFVYVISGLHFVYYTKRMLKL